MKWTRFFLINVMIILFGLALVSTGCESTTGATVLKIVATGNVDGEIEPCG